MATIGQMLVGAPGNLNRVTTAVPLAVTAVANTDLTFQIPAGARNVQFRTMTSTAFTAGTDAQLSIGNAAAGAQYVALVTIKAAGVVSHTYATGAVIELDAVPGAPGTMTTFYVRIVQTGTATAVGAATLFADFSLIPA